MAAGAGRVAAERPLVRRHGRSRVQVVGVTEVPVTSMGGLAVHPDGALAVRDRRLITASGLGNVEFAREVMAELDVLSEPDRGRWQAMFRSGELPTG